MMLILSTLVVAIVASFARAQGEGYLVDSGAFLMPMSIAQCETFSIFSNANGEVSDIIFSTVESNLNFYTFLTISVPLGTGYLEWICNMPTGDQFIVFPGLGVNYAVQPGSSSACLGNLTTTYSLASYDTGIFQSYTATTQSYTGSFASTLSAYFTIQFDTTLYPTSTYPTGPFTTVTVNPNIGVVSTSFTSASFTSAPSTTTSSATASSTSVVPLPSHKSSGRVIAGAVVGVVLFLVILTLILFYWRKSRKSAGISLPTESDPTTSAINQLGSPSIPSPAIPLPQSIEYVHRHPFLSSNAGINPLPNTPPTAVLEPLIPTYPWPEPSSSRSTETPSDLSAALDIITRATPSQRQAFPSLNTSSNVVGDASPQDVPMQTPSRHTSMTDAQNHSPDLTTVLGLLSDAHLTQKERQIVASFTNSLAANPSTPANLTRGNTVSSPPQYSG